MQNNLEIWEMAIHDTAEVHNPNSRELGFLWKSFSEVLFVEVKLGFPGIHVRVFHTSLLQVLG